MARILPVKFFDRKTVFTGFLSLFKVKALLFIIAILCLSSTNLLAQRNSLSVNPTIGLSWRSTAMNFFNFRGLEKYDLRLPYNYEKNVQGFALNPGVQFNLFPFGFEYNVRLRYDYIHDNYDRVRKAHNEPTKGFLHDHNFNFYIKKGITYGAGFSIVNYGAGYEFVNPDPSYHNIEFKTYNLFISFPVKKIVDLEIKAQYIPRDFPYNPYGEYIMYNLRAYYTFKFSNEDNE